MISGRQPELAIFSQATMASSTGAQFVTVSGKRWAGKTALLSAAVSQAERDGASIAWGFPARTLAAEPLSMFTAAFRDHVRRMAGAGQHEADALIDAAAGAPMDSAGERNRAFAAVRSLIERFAGDRPLMLVLDDAHRADPLSVELVEYLLGHPPNAPVLIVIAYRPVGRGPKLAKVLHHAASQCTHIDLDPLDWADCQRLFDPGMNRPDRRLAYDASGGNPGLLRALVAAWRTAADGFGGGTIDDLRTAIPPLMPAEFLVELDSLSADALLLAAAAAVCGDPVSLTLLGQVAEVDEETALSGIDELVAAEILRPTSPGQYEFCDLVMRALSYHRASASWRRGAHRRAARALDSAGSNSVCSNSARRALHVEHLAEPGDEASANLLVHAAREIVLESGTRAERWLRAARTLVPSGDSPDTALLRGRVLTVVGRLTEGHQLLSGVVSAHAGGLTPVLAPAAVAEAAEWCARSARLLGRYADARDTSLRALSSLAGHPDVDTAGLEVELAATRLAVGAAVGTGVVGAGSVGAGVAGPAGASLDQPGGAAESHADMSRRAHALAQRAVAMAARERTAEALDLARIAAYLIDRCGDDEATGQLEALRWLAEAESLLRRHDRAAQHFGRALQLADRRGHRYLSAFLAVGLGRVKLRLGDVDAAAEQADRAGTAADLSASDPMRAAALGLRSQVLVAMGRPAPGADAAMLAVRFSARLHDNWTAYAKHCLGQATSAAKGGGTGHTATRTASHASPAHASATRGAGQAWRHGQSGARREPRPCAPVAVPHRPEPVVPDLSGVSDLSVAPARPVVPVPDQPAVPDGPGAPLLSMLSRRESEIAHLVSGGHTNQQIARALTLSPKTVETYLARIFHKLDISSRSQIAHLVGLTNGYQAAV